MQHYLMSLCTINFNTFQNTSLRNETKLNVTQHKNNKRIFRLKTEKFKEHDPSLKW